MAALSLLFQLSGSRGYSRTVYFTGLGIDACLYPCWEMLGEPYLTRQPFYFLSEMECAVRFHIEAGDLSNILSGTKNLDTLCGALLDNYLFELSCVDQGSRITSKTKRWRFVNVADFKDMYQIDSGNAETVVADVLNDESIEECYDADQGPPGAFYDWLLIEDYFPEIYQQYVKKMRKLLKKRIVIRRKTNSDKIEEKELQLIRPRHQLYTFEDLRQLDRICSPDRQEQSITGNKLHIASENGVQLEIPFVRVKCDHIYNPHLLAFYFAGLREDVPMDTFKQWFNIIEYFFEDASLLALRAQCPPELASTLIRWSDITKQREQIAKALKSSKYDVLSERSMTRYVLTQLVSDKEFKEDLKNLSKDARQYFQGFRYESGNIKIVPMSLHSRDLRETYADRLYLIRCGVIHSKKYYLREPGFCFLPFTHDEHVIEMEIELLRRVVQRLIKKEAQLLVGEPLETGGAARFFVIEKSWQAGDYGTALDEMPRVILFASYQSEDLREIYQDFYAEKIATMLDRERLDEDFERDWFIERLTRVVALLDTDKEMRAYVLACILLLQGRTREAISIQYTWLSQRLRAWICRLVTSLQPIFLREMLSKAGLCVDRFFAVMTGEVINSGGHAVPAVIVVEREGDSPRAITLRNLEEAGSEEGQLHWIEM